MKKNRKSAHSKESKLIFSPITRMSGFLENVKTILLGDSYY